MSITVADVDIQVGADTNPFEKYLKASLARMSKLGEKESQKTSKAMITSFGQMHFSLAKFALKVSGVISTLVPLPTALVGVAAGAVALGGAVGLASGSLLTLGTVASSLVGGLLVAKLATKGLSDALSNMGDPEKLAEALEKLAPSAQKFVLAVKSVSGSWKDLQQSLQQDVFKGLAPRLKAVSANLLPAVSRGFDGLGKTLNTAAKGFFDFFASTRGRTMVGTVLTGMNKILRQLLPALGSVGRALGTLFAASLPQGEKMAGTIRELATRFEEWSAKITESGAFQDFLSRASGAASVLLEVLGNLGGIIVSVFGAGAATGTGMLATFRDSTAALQELLSSASGQSALASFFGTTKVAAQAFSDVVGAAGPVLSGLGTVLEQLGPPLDKLRAALLPVVTTLGEQLGSALNFIAPIVGFLANAFAELVSFIAPILPIVLPLVAGFLLFSKVLRIVRTGILFARGAMLLLNLAMVLNPVGLLIAALAGLAAIIFLTWKKSETFRTIVIGVWNAIKVATSVVWNGITAVIKGAWNAIVAVFSWVFNFIAGIVTTGWNILKALFTPPLMVIGALIKAYVAVWAFIFKAIFAIIGTIVATAWVLIKQFIVTPLMWLVNRIRTGTMIWVTIFRGVFRMLIGLVREGWAKIKAIFGPPIEWMINIFKSAFNKVKSVVSSAWNNIVSNFNTAKTLVVMAVTRLWDKIRGIFDKIKSVSSNLWSGLTSGLGSAINGLVGLLNSMIGKVNSAISGFNKLPGPDIPKIPSIPGLFTGAQNFEGGMAMVGERGRELVRLPKGADVIPNGRTEQIMSNSGTSTPVVVNQNYYGPTTSNGRLREIDQTLRYSTKARAPRHGGMATA